MTNLELLLARTVTTPSGCIEWVGARLKHKYPQFCYGIFHPKDENGRNTKAVRAHRWRYEYEHGPIPDGMFVMHKCDNPPCVNIDHLTLGTANDNVQDMVTKGRQARPIGVKHPQARINDHDVVAIRQAVAAGATRKAMASKYGLCVGSIDNIVTGKSWTHVGDQPQPETPAIPLTTRVLANNVIPYIYQAYVYEAEVAVWSCTHRHGERGIDGRKTAQDCANRGLAKVRRRLTIEARIASAMAKQPRRP